jgi:hypothetical protein
VIDDMDAISLMCFTKVAILSEAPQARSRGICNFPGVVHPKPK